MSDVRAAVLAEIRRILSTELEITDPVEPHHELARDLRVDSMGAIVLAVGLEDTFRVKLSDEDAGAVVTVGDLVDLVDRRARGDRTENGAADEQREVPR
jgi:acyl carrier protein